MAGIGGWLTGLLGSKNTAKAAGRQVSSGSYNYGGDPNAAENEANRLAAQGDAAQQREGVQVNYGQADQDRARALQGRDLSMQARQGQGQAANLSLARALGQTPSIAQMQADRQMQQASADQASAAAGARGAGGLALAQQNAAGNVANAHANISGQAQINAAGERLAAEQAASGAFGQLRGGDLASQGQDLAMQGQSANQAQAQAGFADAQRARNDQVQQGNNALANNVRMGQLGARMNYEGQQSANDLGAQGINAGVGGQNASMNQANGMAMLGLGQAAAGTVFGSFGGGGGTPPPKAKGGPVEGRSPYLVGERGPELIIPAKDGMVIPAGPTQDAIQRTPSLARFLSARAEGGPVEGGGDVVPRTWGDGPKYAPASTGLGDAFQTASAASGAQAESFRDRQGPGAMMAVPGFSPGTDTSRDEPLVRRDREISSHAAAYEGQGLPLTDREEWEAAGADRRIERSKKNDKAAKKKSLAETLGGTPPKTLNDKVADILANGANVDTAYHGPGGGYVPPPLVQLPGRAFGGPVMGGGAPSMLVPLSGPGSGSSDVPGLGVQLGPGGAISQADIRRASTGLAGGSVMPGMVGGGGITGGMNVPGANAREDGGPVKAGGAVEYVEPIDHTKTAYDHAADQSDAAADRAEATASLLDPLGTNPLIRAAVLAPAFVNRGRAVGERYVVPAMDRAVQPDRPIGRLLSAILGGRK